MVKDCTVPGPGFLGFTGATAAGRRGVVVVGAAGGAVVRGGGARDPMGGEGRPATPAPAPATTMSPRRTPRLRMTTPSEGRVSSPENGGERKAVRAKPNTIAPKAMPVRRFPSRPAIRGRENFSNHRIRLSRALE